MSRQSVLLFVLLPLGIYALALQATSDLTPEQKLKAQVQQLTEQNLQLQASLAQCQLTTQATENKIQHQILDREFRATLKCADDDDLEGWPPIGCKKKAPVTTGSKPPQ